MFKKCQNVNDNMEFDFPGTAVKIEKDGIDSALKTFKLIGWGFIPFEL
jgi:hypothetical protein